MTNKKEDYYWLNRKSRKFLSRGYLEAGQTAEDRIEQICKHAESILNIPGFGDKFKGYLAKGYYSLSSPIWSNFGTDKGLPISCFSSYIPDDLEGILGKVAEVGMMTKIGGGTSGYFGEVRPRGSATSSGGTSCGAVHFMQLYETTTNVVSQSNVRRGQFAAYLPIDHADLSEFLEIKEPGNPIQNLHLGVCITDDWMKDMVYGKNWDKREIWASVVRKRFASGEPYLFFTDNVNNNAPQVYKDKGLKIHGSNLCSEICLSTSADESFVCDLSSMNLLHFEEWVETDAVETLIYFLDAVMTDFINKVKDVDHMQAPYRFAVKQRALGLGVLGWHSFLQSKMLAFESFEAKMFNVRIFKTIKERAVAASKELATKYGEPELMKGTGLRNSTLIAIAPTTSSSQILGQVSQGIEPLNSNYFVKGLAKGDFTYKNPYLKDVLKKHSKNDDDTWESILVHGGSVQHLTFLSQEEKDVFKTFGEISQKEIVIQAAARQRYIDQSQSLNILIPPNVDPKEVSDLLIFGWEQGIKTFYYQRSANAAQELNRSILTCKSCEG